MSTIAFRVTKKFKQQLTQLADYKGITLSALIKLYLHQQMRKDLEIMTENEKSKFQ